MAVVALLSKIIQSDVLHAILPLSKETRERLCLRLTQTAWRVSLAFSPWIRTSCTERSHGNWEQYLKDKAASKDGPMFILSNHESFSDTILTVSKFPMAALLDTRCYMSISLFKMPILGTICKAIGHFPVHFSSGQDGKFTVDKEKSALVEEDVDTHLAAGGTLALYPEGQLNKDPDGGLQPFRYGAFRRALACDAKLWGLVTINHHVTWPRKAKVGGLPARTMWDFQPLAPEGCRKLLETLKAERAKAGEEETDDFVVLAKGVQALMQQQHDELRAALK